MQGQKTSGGFTLIETLVAMMVLSISLVVIMQLFSQGLHSTVFSGDYTRAVFHAREKMEEIMLLDALPSGTFEGVFQDGFKWHAAIVEQKADDQDSALTPFSLFQITVYVTWQDGSREKQFELTSQNIAEPVKEDDDAKQ